MKRREQDGGHDGSAAWLGGNTAEAIPARFHNGGKRIYSAVAFLLFREGREIRKTGGETLIISSGKFVDCGMAEVETIPLGS